MLKKHFKRKVRTPGCSKLIPSLRWQTISGLKLQDYLITDFFPITIFYFDFFIIFAALLMKLRQRVLFS